MNADRDVIFVNPRGTMHSDPFLSCPEDRRIHRSSRSIWSSPGQSTADLAAAAVADCRKRLATTGVDFAAYNSLENATDHADLRTALGIEGMEPLRGVLRFRPGIADSAEPPGRCSFGGPGFGGATEHQHRRPMVGGPGQRTGRDHPGVRGPISLHRCVPRSDADVHRRPSMLLDRDTGTGHGDGSVRDGTCPSPSTDAKLVPLLVDWSRDATRVADIPRMIYAASRGDVTLAAEAIAASDLPAEQRGILGYGLTLGAYCQEMTNWTTPEEALAGARKAMPGPARRRPAGHTDGQPHLRRVPRLGRRPIAILPHANRSPARSRR